MGLRSDPVTRSWVLVGHQEETSMPANGCPLCPGRAALRVLLELPSPAAAQVRVIPHFRALYRIEGDAERRPDGIYDRMRSVGAHEIISESPNHDQSLARMGDDQIERVKQGNSMVRHLLVEAGQAASKFNFGGYPSTQYGGALGGFAILAMEQKLFCHGRLQSRVAACACWFKWLEANQALLRRWFVDEPTYYKN